jgi:hypothetical protein
MMKPTRSSCRAPGRAERSPKRVAITVGVLIGPAVGCAATGPGAFRVQRGTRITAPPERIFALINQEIDE